MTGTSVWSIVQPVFSLTSSKVVYGKIRSTLSSFSPAGFLKMHSVVITVPYPVERSGCKIYVFNKGAFIMLGFQMMTSWSLVRVALPAPPGLSIWGYVGATR